RVPLRRQGARGALDSVDVLPGDEAGRRETRGAVRAARERGHEPPADALPARAAHGGRVTIPSSERHRRARRTPSRERARRPLARHALNRRWWRGLCWAAGLFSASIVSPTVLAQTPVARPTQLPAFGRSVVGTDDATAIVLNPANLAFLPASELRWSSVYLDEQARVPYQGHAFGLALPIPFLSMGAGVRVDILDPPEALASSVSRFRSDYWWLTTALAFRAGQSAAFGLSYAHAYSDGIRVDGTDAFSFALTTRPSNYFGMSAAVHALGGPSS